MLDPITLDAEQEAAVTKMIKDTSGAALVAAGTGVGKTVLSVEYIKRAGARTVLAIVPLQTIGHELGEDDEYAEGWWGTVNQQQLDLPVKQIDSTDTGKSNLVDLQWGVDGFYLVTHEMFTRMGWVKNQQFNRDKTPKKRFDKKLNVWVDVFKNERTDVWDVTVDVILYDEIHRAQNINSVTFKTLRGGGLNGGIKSPKKRMKFLGLSGTYEGSSFEGAHAVTLLLWPKVIDASHSVWIHKWAETKFDPFAVGNVKVVGERDPGAYVSHLPCYVFIEAKFDIEVESKVFTLDLYPEQRRIYDELEANMVAWVKDNPLVTKFPITKRIRQRQATLGMPTLTYVEGEGGELEVEVDFDNECESAKIDVMFEDVLDGFFESEPALIFTDSQKFARVLTYRINKFYGEGSAREWSGKTGKLKRREDKAAFIRGDYKYMVAVIKASGTGTNNLQLRAANSLYVSSDDSLVQGIQSRARTLRRGQKADKVRFAYLIANNTVDDPQYQSLVDREIEANKRKRVKK